MPENAKDRAALNDAKSRVMPDENPSDKQPCPYMKRLRISVFFDGTDNNKYRDEALGRETNVVRLHKLYHDKEDEIAARDKLYLIGVGAVDTSDETYSDTDRQRQATGAERVQHGIKATMISILFGRPIIDPRVFTGEDDFFGRTLGKVAGLGSEERLNIAYKWVKEKVITHEGKYTKESEKVVDIYGFSRGATLARTFINLVNQGLVRQEKLQNLRVRFLGIFDTVGSVGIPGSLWGGGLNPGQNLGLDSSDFDACSHFTARHEYRANFPLSTLPGFDREYTGAHSDVGGGYGDDTGDHKLKNCQNLDDKEKGKRNHLQYITYVDMHKESVAREVEMDDPMIPGDVDLTNLRKDADTYGGGGEEMCDPNGSFPQERQTWFDTYVHESASEWFFMVQFFNPNKPRTKDGMRVREKLEHKKKTLRGLPPNFSWRK